MTTTTLPRSPMLLLPLPPPFIPTRLQAIQGDLREMKVCLLPFSSLGGSSPARPDPDPICHISEQEEEGKGLGWVRAPTKAATAGGKGNIHSRRFPPPKKAPFSSSFPPLTLLFHYFFRGGIQRYLFAVDFRGVCSLNIHLVVKTIGGPTPTA